MIKECRSFVGMVNFVSIFCPELQGLLKPIYDLTRKGRCFIWGEEQQKAFYEIKSRLQRPPVLHLPDRQGQFQLYSDTSKFATGSALYQIQNGQPNLIAYSSKRMPEAAKNYSITELEMCGLAINIASFMHFLKKVDFDAIVDHLAITHIMRSKTEPATTRNKRLLELLSSYSFNFYYIKGNDMVLSDFLSRQKTDDSNPHEIISISFSLRKVLHESYYRISDLTKTIDSETDKYLVQTRSQAKSSGVKVPEVHSANKGLILHMKPEKSVAVPIACLIPPTHHLRPIHHTPHTDQRPPINAVPPLPKPRIGQGRAGIRRKPKVTLPMPNPIQMPSPPIPKPAPRTTQPLTEPVTQSQDSVLPQHHVPAVPQPLLQPTAASIAQPVEPIIDHRPIPPYHEPFVRPPPRPPDVAAMKDNRKDLSDLDMDRKIEFEENSPHEEGIISEAYERPDKSYIQEPTELKDLIDTTKLIQKFLPKQANIEKIFHIIKRKVLKGTHLPLTIKEIQTGYLTCPYFKDLYLYLAQNKLPSKKSAMHKVENLAERFILLDSLLFKIITTPERETVLLTVPEMCGQNYNTIPY